MTEQVDLRTIALFEQLSVAALAKLAAILESRALPAGAVLFDKGDPGDEMYIVGSGRIALYIPNPEKPGEERPIRIINPGEVLGEMALIDNQPRSVSGRTIEPAEVLVLRGDGFHQLLRDHPEVALAVMSGLNNRIRYTTDFLGEVREWVRRVASGEYERGFAPQSDYQDRSIAALAAEFAQMAAQVQKREEALRQEIVELRIEIDEAKKERQVGEIVESEYFQNLRAQAEKLRRRRE
jgi:CRP-like cAMP-binding protein